MTVSCVVHMPICVPSGEQTDWPAVEHVPVDDVEDVVELDVELVSAEGAELGAAAATDGAAATGEAAAEGAADAATDGAMDGATDGAADAGAAEATLYNAEGADPDPEALDPDEGDDPAADALEFDDPDEPPPATTLHLAPVGGVSVLVPSFSTEVPGSGNSRSAESTVSQSVVGMFATNMPGKDDVARPESSGMPRVSLRVAALFADPPLILTDAQFMYISRLPILLNQVQAKVYDPAVIPWGMV